MNVIQLLPIGAFDARLLEDLRPGIEAEFRARCEIVAAGLEPEFAFHGARQQYHSTEILARMRRFLGAGAWRLLGVTGVDLFIPILTFVFGEAQLGNTCAVVSTHRLRKEYYGLPPDADLLRERLLKEAVHELGHTLGLTHCPDYSCAMAPSHGVEWIDIKGSRLCAACRTQILPVVHPS